MTQPATTGSVPCALKQGVPATKGQTAMTKPAQGAPKPPAQPTVKPVHARQATVHRKAAQGAAKTNAVHKGA